MIVLLFAAMLRFIWLDRIPIAIGGDEIIYSLTAKSVYLTGKDMTGTWNITDALLFKNPPGQQSAELPYFLQLSVSMFPLSLLTAHIPFALLSMGIVLLMYAVTLKLFNTRVALIAAALTAINPWFITMGRTGYEATPATFFFLLGLYVLLVTEGWKQFISLLPFILAFYSYIGTKISFLPFIAASILFTNRRKLRNTRLRIGIYLLIAGVFVTFYYFMLKSNPESRLSNLYLPTNPDVAAAVDALRKHSMDSPLTPFFINKFTVYADSLVGKLLHIFSFPYLFFDGDYFFPVHGIGFFYPLDAVFLLYGLLMLFKRHRKTFNFLIVLLLIGALPQVFFYLPGDYSLHITLLFPFMLIVIAYGIYRTLLSVQNHMRLITTGILTAIYLILATRFAFIYFYVHPLQEYGDFQYRVLSKYITEAVDRGYTVHIQTSHDRDVLGKYLFYTDSINRQTNSIVSKNTSEYRIGNAVFSGCVPIKTPEAMHIYIVDSVCPTTLPVSHDSISRLSDGGEILRIYNDKICGAYGLKQYPSGLTLESFSVESLSTQKFCKTYISSY